MTDISGFVNLIWTFLSGWNIPWINISPASFILTMLVITLSINILGVLLGLGRGKLSHIRPRHRNSSTGGKEE